MTSWVGSKLVRWCVAAQAWFCWIWLSISAWAIQRVVPTSVSWPGTKSASKYGPVSVGVAQCHVWPTTVGAIWMQPRNSWV